MKTYINIWSVILFFFAAPAVAQTDLEEETFEIFDISQKAEFPGGQDGLNEYIRKNLTFPPEALEYDVSGTINVMFIIDKKGHVKNIEIFKAELTQLVPIKNKKGKVTGNKKVKINFDENDYGFRKSVFQLLKNSPRWTPAKQKEKNVNMRFRLPLKFQIY